jgi:hypothetical protein
LYMITFAMRWSTATRPQRPFSMMGSPSLHTGVQERDVAQSLILDLFANDTISTRTSATLFRDSVRFVAFTVRRVLWPSRDSFGAKTVTL